MWISRWFVLFVIFSILGWVYETIFCTIKGGKWENRGFLYGPLCPIYGAGSVSLMAVVGAIASTGFEYRWWHVFLIGFVGSIVLEYTTHFTLEKLFHAYWWDYSRMPLNIKGRVCLPYSLCFGGAALIVTYLFAPIAMRFANALPPIWFEAIALVSMLILGMDVALTAAAISNFEVYIASAEESVNKYMDQFVDNIQEKKDTVTETVSNKFAEEKERFSRERVTENLKQMSVVSKSAIRRIQGFMPRKGEKKENNIKNRALMVLKNKLPGRNKG